MQQFNILVGVIPIYKNDLLLTQRSLTEKFLPGAWGIPCGKIDFGETLEDAVKRELFEETGLSGTIKRMVGYSMFMSTKGDTALHNLQINYIVDIDKPEPVILDKSSQSYRWISINEYHSVGLDEFTEKTIAQAIE